MTKLTPFDLMLQDKLKEKKQPLDKHGYYVQTRERKKTNCRMLALDIQSSIEAAIGKKECNFIQSVKIKSVSLVVTLRYNRDEINIYVTQAGVSEYIDLNFEVPTRLCTRAGVHRSVAVLPQTTLSGLVEGRSTTRFDVQTHSTHIKSLFKNFIQEIASL